MVLTTRGSGFCLQLRLLCDITQAQTRKMGSKHRSKAGSECRLCKRHIYLLIKAYGKYLMQGNACQKDLLYYAIFHEHLSLF
jgi:hypothetical protein